MNRVPMTPLLEQFLAESREILESVGTKLMQLEDAPTDQAIINELFRLVHTLKGNSGLFTIPEMTRILHAGEDLLGTVRSGNAAFSRELADRLLDAMDFVGVLCGEIAATEGIDPSRVAETQRMADALRKLMPTVKSGEVCGAAQPKKSMESQISRPGGSQDSPDVVAGATLPLSSIPEVVRMAAFRQWRHGESLFWMSYRPQRECFFHGDDPLNSARQTPGLLWGRVVALAPLPTLDELDIYNCALGFDLLTAAAHEELDEFYRYIPDQVAISPVNPLLLVIPQGDLDGLPADESRSMEALRLLAAGDLANLGQLAQAMLDEAGAESWFSSALRWLLCMIEADMDWVRQNLHVLSHLIRSFDTLVMPDWAHLQVKLNVSENDTSNAFTPTEAAPQRRVSLEDRAAIQSLISAQRQTLMLEDRPVWHAGRLRAVAAVLNSLANSLGDAVTSGRIQTALNEATLSGSNASMLQCLDSLNTELEGEADFLGSRLVGDQGNAEKRNSKTARAPAMDPGEGRLDEGIKSGRRAEDRLAGPRTLKVDQAKIDRLMNLIGELVVSKNALPYLAERAESQFGMRELSREIKFQYAGFHRIADEMQDAIMQVRMMAVSSIFQRFPRMVRDISRKLGKEVQLVLEGEQTEADKNVIEAIADPLIHIVRNSLDHGLELPEERNAAGKPQTGKLVIRATQEGDRVVIEVVDDGRGIDPAVIKRQAYEKGLIDEAALEQLGDQDAINLIFAAGLSTATVVSDLSGRGVGMDVVRSAVEKINGKVHLSSEIGKGTTIRISLPLSVAVTQVMVIESDRQLFGVPMDQVVETLRIPRNSIRTIKQCQTAVLRGRIVPLKSLNSLLEISAMTKSNSDDELAVLLVQAGSAEVGLLVDGFQETMGVIQKPLNGFLSGVTAYSGSALMGDGSVLMILNIREII